MGSIEQFSHWGLGQLIQFTPDSAFHFTVDFFNFVQNSIELFPVISPTPNLLSFHPPKLKGSLGTGTPTFTPIIPALDLSMTYLAIAIAHEDESEHEQIGEMT